jgi:hypothetical protein
VSVNRTLLLCASLAVSSVVALHAGAEVRMINASPRAEKVTAANAAARRPIVDAANAQKWVATKAIIFDQETKSLRKPTETETATLVRTLRQLSNKPARAVKSASAGMTDGTTRQGSAKEALTYIVVARAAADGTMETRCVASMDEAADFLGLVPQSPENTQQ